MKSVVSDHGSPLRFVDVHLVENLLAAGQWDEGRDDLAVVEDVDAAEATSGVPVKAVLCEHVGVAAGGWTYPHRNAGEGSCADTMSVTTENQSNVGAANRGSQPLRVAQGDKLRLPSRRPDRRMMDDEHGSVGSGFGELDGQCVELRVVQLAVDLIRDARVHADEPEPADAYHRVERVAFGLLSEQMHAQERDIVVIAGSDRKLGAESVQRGVVTGRGRTYASASPRFATSPESTSTSGEQSAAATISIEACTRAQASTRSNRKPSAGTCGSET